ncbi:DUF4097 family beta strand repeat-containing protein [Luteimonas sp. 22616]|jgi:hypothetical protein|uniref:DUF4097 family beta strand repeat-containing protein n=1 Tax=Luteimonas sp. 22616 TaxID=3453951 RepID=UPI003F82CADD
MHKLILGALLLLPLAAQASDDDHCKHSQPRNLQLDLAGVKTVVFDIGGNDLDVRASASPSNKVDGRACASSGKDLDRLVLTQEKTGERLLVHARREGNFGGIFLGNHYAYMKLQASVPDSVAVRLKVGSGDASVDGARTASVDTGSGDVHVSRIRGELTAAIGSGDLEAEDIGSLHLLSVGSGDATFRNVRGASKVGSIGSGDLGIRTTQGPVEIGSVGSGDVELADIGGSVTVGSIGSGDIDADGVRGDLDVRSIGSGDVGHRGVTGRVTLPRKN